MDVDVSWYIDGSLFDGYHFELARAGFAIAAVDRAGRLVAAAHGRTPGWIFSASGAELWALGTVLGLCPSPPCITTDCKTLLRGTRLCHKFAADHRRPLARAWARVANALDSHSAKEAATEQLCWMPAHRAACTAIGRLVKSDGRKVSAIDWRANRLVDHMAKAAARPERAPEACRLMVQQALEAAEFGAAFAGTTTWAANNHRVAYQKADGATAYMVKRDSAGHRPFPATRQQMTEMYGPVRSADTFDQDLANRIQCIQCAGAELEDEEQTLSHLSHHNPGARDVRNYSANGGRGKWPTMHPKMMQLRADARWAAGYEMPASEQTETVNAEVAATIWNNVKIVPPRLLPDPDSGDEDSTACLAR